MKSNNPIPARNWEGYHFYNHLAWASFLFLLALKLQHISGDSMSYANKERGYRAPLTRQMVLDLERQHNEKVRREKEEKIVIYEAIEKYGGVPEWLKPHLPPDYDLESRLESISADLKVIRKTLEDPITC